MRRLSTVRDSSRRGAGGSCCSWTTASVRVMPNKLPAAAQRDERAIATVHRVRQAWQQATLPPEQRERVRWMIEELRVSLFAQQLGTPYPVSEQRIYRALPQS